MVLLECDVGSSSIRASLVDAQDGRCIGSDFSPATEMEIRAPFAGWVEQNPECRWRNLQVVTGKLLKRSGVKKEDIAAVEIAYQIRGLVVIDKRQQVLRPAVIGCDSRAVSLGDEAFQALGQTYCLEHLLNSPGNFTASRLAWIKKNEPDLFDRIDKILLPGDYIAMRLTGEAATTLSGLSEGIFWDFRENTLSERLLHYYGFDRNVIPALVPAFGYQGELSAVAAEELGLKKGIPVTYRAGDQPNNAFSLGVLHPGEVASTAGTSGVVYGILDRPRYDTLSRINCFAHVNYTEKDKRIGALLCINGTAILNAWLKRNVAPEGISYAEMNRLGLQVPAGAEGVSILPFGNGAERMLGNRDTGASVHGLCYNIHDRRHLIRAAQEGIAYSFRYGMEIMERMGIDLRIIKAAYANLYLSPLFREALAGAGGSVIELYDADGGISAARGAGVGAGIYGSPEEAASFLRKVAVTEPGGSDSDAYRMAYRRWKEWLETGSDK